MYIFCNICNTMKQKSGQVHFSSLNPSFMRDLFTLSAKRMSRSDNFPYAFLRILAELFYYIGKFKELSYIIKNCHTRNMYLHSSVTVILFNSNHFDKIEYTSNYTNSSTTSIAASPFLWPILMILV